MSNKSNWRDESSYSQGDTNKTVTCVTCYFDGFRISVHRHIDYPGQWLVSCHPIGFRTVLDSTELTEAKKEGLLKVEQYLVKMVESILAQRVLGSN